jgi:hypothetical protein
LIVLAGVATVVGVVGLGFWAKGKAESMQAELKKIEELSTKADAIPFTEPEDGVIQENRLVTFLDARKRLFPVYEKHRLQLEEIQNADKKRDTNISDVSKVVGLVGVANEIQQAHLQTLIDVGMSRNEYRYLTQAIYKTAWAAELQRSTGGKTAAQATDDAMKQAARALEEQAQRTPDPSLPPEAQRAMREAQEQARKQQAELERQAPSAVAQARAADVPEQNLALFQKYEADIKKYAMTGLEWLAL